MELVKREDRYDLYGDDGAKIASSSPNPFGKLSKENCDEIFGVVDLMKLAEENSHKYYDVKTTDWHCNYNGFIGGFNKAMELNKDKLFTENQIREAIKQTRHGMLFKKKYEDEFIQSLQQLTEIEVEIEMESTRPIHAMTDKGIKTFTQKEKLDENGCLILKKK